MYSMFLVILQILVVGEKAPKESGRKFNFFVKRLRKEIESLPTSKKLAEKNVVIKVIIIRSVFRLFAAYAEHVSFCSICQTVLCDIAAYAEQLYDLCSVSLTVLCDICSI